jgi:hypothetical protein
VARTKQGLRPRGLTISADSLQLAEKCPSTALPASPFTCSERSRGLRQDTTGSIIGVSKAEKLVERMRASPKDWTMSSLEVVARHCGMAVRKSGGSHFVFLHSRSEIAVSIPYRRPIKPIYITQFLALIDDIGTRE